MVYNSTVDALESKDEDGYSIYFQNGNQHFNRIYFKYPLEWKTSNVGEKIIGIRRMNIHRKTDSNIYGDLLIINLLSCLERNMK